MSVHSLLPSAPVTCASTMTSPMPLHGSSHTAKRHLLYTCAFDIINFLPCRQRPPTMQATSLQPLAPPRCAELSPSAVSLRCMVSWTCSGWAHVLFTRTVLEPNGFRITLKIMVGYRCTCTRKTEREDQTFDVWNELTTTTTVFLYISPGLFAF